MRASWERHVARMWKMRNAYKILRHETSRKETFPGPSHRWKDGIKVNI